MSAALIDSFLEKRSGDAGPFEDAEALEEVERPSFLLPAVADPATYAAHRFGVYTGDKEKELPYFMTKGTTTLSFIYSGGVVVSVDSRSTQGPYIASGSVKKIIEINPYLLGTMAGGAADCSFWYRELGKQCRLWELRNKERISVAAASKLFSNTLYGYKGYGLSVGSMCSGWGSNGPELFYCDNDGTRYRAKPSMPYFCVGSGGTYAYSVLDAGYKWEMTDEEAIDLGQRAIYHATHRDSYSGGINNLYLVKPSGWIKVWSGDVNELHAKYEKEGTTAAMVPPVATGPITKP